MKMYLVSRLGGLWTCILPFWMTAIRSVEGGWIRDLLNEPSAILGGKRSPVTKVWEKLIEEGEIELHPNLRR
jgi:hypothetical protein